jgi:hypothetical protein
MPYGYKVLIQRVPDPGRHHARWAGPVVIAALALVAVSLLIWPARNTPAVPAPAAHIAAAPITPASSPPAPKPYVVRITPQTGAVCFLPGGKTIGPVTLAEVP